MLIAGGRLDEDEMEVDGQMPIDLATAYEQAE